MNLTVSFISSLSSPVYLLVSLGLSTTLAPVPRNLFSPLLGFSLSLFLPISEFCAELPAIIIIALLPIISTTPLRNCTSMLLIHFLFGQRGLTVDEKSQIPLRNFRPIESSPLSLFGARLYILQQQILNNAKSGTYVKFPCPRQRKAVTTIISIPRETCSLLRRTRTFPLLNISLP